MMLETLCRTIYKMIQVHIFVRKCRFNSCYPHQSRASTRESRLGLLLYYSKKLALKRHFSVPGYNAQSLCLYGFERFFIYILQQITGRKTPIELHPRLLDSYDVLSDRWGDLYAKRNTKQMHNRESERFIFLFFLCFGCII